MKWKNRLTNYNFWISIVSAVLLIFQAFNFEFDIAYINEIATAVLGLLVVIGIISDPTKTYTPTEQGKETTNPVVNEGETTTETSEEIVKENQQEQPNADAFKNEDGYICNQGNFKTIVDFISSEINKTVNTVLELSNKAQSLEQVDKEIVTDENKTVEENPTSHNIVN